MIFSAACPLEAVCTELRALHVALNSPVVRQDPLPVGPASAAVALHSGVPGVSVAIRSVRTGQVAFFTTDLDSPPTPGMAVDAALSFAEALGFVFDEDEVGRDGVGGRAAARLWCELIGEAYQAADPAGTARSDAAGAGAPPADESDEGDDARLREILGAVSTPAPDPRQILSKFRWPSGPAAEAPAAQRKIA
jgi:hypothetical protein